MRFVIVESPYACSGCDECSMGLKPPRDGVCAGVWKNIGYAKECILDCLKRGEAPVASHLLYTQVLNDRLPVERTLGIQAGFELRTRADATVVYTDFGISEGMRMGVADAYLKKVPVEYRSLLETPLQKLTRLSEEAGGYAELNAVPRDDLGRPLDD